MISQRKLFGGSAYLGTNTSKILPIYSARYIIGAPSSAAIYHLPRIGPLPRGGPHWVIINQGSADITIRRSDGVDIGVVDAGDRVRIFLLTAVTLGVGAGTWRIAGSGNSFVGDQLPSTDAGFNYGAAAAYDGLETDLGSAVPITPQHNQGLDFGSAVLSAPPILLP